MSFGTLGKGKNLQVSILREEIRWEDNQQVRVLERTSKSEFVTKTSAPKRVAPVI